jgi:hypothetical protein
LGKIEAGENIYLEKKERKHVFKGGYKGGIMSKLKHTPGPWKIDPEDNDELIIFQEDSDTYEFIAEINPHSCKEKEHTMANACLIAAAPEMLDALIQSFKLIFEQWDNGDLNTECYELFLNNAQKIIEKATGQKIEDLIK